MSETGGQGKEEKIDSAGSLGWDTASAANHPWCLNLPGVVGVLGRMREMRERGGECEWQLIGRERKALRLLRETFIPGELHIWEG